MTYTMAEPSAPVRSNVLLICPHRFPLADLERMAALLAARRIRCFASTLTPDKVPNGEERETAAPDQRVLLGDLLGRIRNEDDQAGLDLILIGEASFSAGDLIRDGIAVRDEKNPMEIHHVAQLTEAQPTTNPAVLPDRLLVTETAMSDLTTVLDWLDKVVSPWLLATSSGSGREVDGA